MKSGHGPLTTNDRKARDKGAIGSDFFVKKTRLTNLQLETYNYAIVIILLYKTIMPDPIKYNTFCVYLTPFNGIFMKYCDTQPPGQ